MHPYPPERRLGPHLAQHVHDLCTRENIDVEWCRRLSQAGPYVASCEIHIAPIRSVVSYAVALHAIGYVKGFLLRVSPRCIVCERWAWDWARREAIIWTPRMERQAHTSLAWFEEKAAWAVFLDASP